MDEHGPVNRGTDSFVLVQQVRRDLDTQKIKAHSIAMSYSQLEPLKIMRFINMLKYAELLFECEELKNLRMERRQRESVCVSESE